MTEEQEKKTRNKSQVNVPPTSFMSRLIAFFNREMEKSERKAEHVQWYGRIVFKHCKSMEEKTCHLVFSIHCNGNENLQRSKKTGRNLFIVYVRINSDIISNNDQHIHCKR